MGRATAPTSGHGVSLEGAGAIFPTRALSGPGAGGRSPVVTPRGVDAVPFPALFRVGTTVSRANLEQGSSVFKVRYGEPTP